jgi:hypothetical protein
MPTRCLNGGSQSEEERARNRHDQAEYHRPAIELEGEQDREIGRDLKLLKQLHRGVADSNTEHSATNRDQQALRHQLADESGSSGADGRSHRAQNAGF